MTSIRPDIIEQAGCTIVYDRNEIVAPNRDLFNALSWGHFAKPHQEGRGTVWFIDNPPRQWVLKHYQRGGLFARVLGKRYVALGYNRTRMVREFNLLSTLWQRGLPVPRPVAALVQRSYALVYSGSLITERLFGCQSLNTLLQTDELDPVRWQQIGQTVKRFHDANVFHHDLNAANVLIDGESVFLIDFDKCKIESESGNAHWKQSNIQRFKRSLDKLVHAGGQVTEQHWRCFLEGYR